VCVASLLPRGRRCRRSKCEHHAKSSAKLNADGYPEKAKYLRVRLIGLLSRMLSVGYYALCEPVGAKKAVKVGLATHGL